MAKSWPFGSLDQLGFNCKWSQTTFDMNQDKIKWTSNFMNLDKIRGQQKNFSEHHEEA